MNRLMAVVVCLAPAVITVTAAGCSNRPKVTQTRLDEVAQEKVDLMRKLADEVAKNPNSVEVAGLVDAFLNTPIDPKAYPTQTAEILKIYNDRVKGKIPGEPGLVLRG